MIKKLSFVLMIMFAVYGCSTVVDYSNQPNEYLFAEGYRFMDNGQNERAAGLFRNIILNADNPSNAQTAQKLMGDAYFLDGKYLDAIAAYEIYYELYRRSPDLPYIIYMLGVSYGNISLSGGRDTTYAKKAIDYFDELEARFPAQYEDYAAGAHRAVMAKKLSDYEYRVAAYYVRIDRYEPAVTRLLGLINTYPGAPTEEDAYVLLVESTLELEEREELAADYLNELKRLYPENKKIASLEKKLNNTINE